MPIEYQGQAINSMKWNDQEILGGGNSGGILEYDTSITKNLQNGWRSLLDLTIDRYHNTLNDKFYCCISSIDPKQVYDDFEEAYVYYTGSTSGAYLWDIDANVRWNVDVGFKPLNPVNIFKRSNQAYYGVSIATGTCVTANNSIQPFNLMASQNEGGDTGIWGVPLDYITPYQLRSGYNWSTADGTFKSVTIDPRLYLCDYTG